MAIFTGTVRSIPPQGVPEPWELRTTDGRVLYLRIGSDFRAFAQMVDNTGQLIIVEGDEGVGSFNLPLVDVRSMRLAPVTPLPPPPPPPPPPTRPVGPAAGKRVTLIGFIRPPDVRVPGVTHTLVERNGRRWLLLAGGESLEELNDILEDFQEEGEDELARVTGVTGAPVQGQPTVTVFSAEEVEDDDDDDNDNGSDNSLGTTFAAVAPENGMLSPAVLRAAIANLLRLLAQRGVLVTPAQALQLMQQAVALSQLLAARGTAATPLQVLQLLIQRLPRQSFPL